MHYTSVLFDLDGTLLDTLGDLTAAMNRTLTRHGLPERTRQQMRTALGNGARRLMELSVPSGTDSALFETLLAEYNADYAAHCRIETAPYPGVAALLRTLHTQGRKLAIVSNKPDEAVRALRADFFADAVQIAVGETAAIRRKPAPDMLLAVSMFDAGNSPFNCGGAYALTAALTGGERLTVCSVLGRMLRSVPFDTFLAILLLGLLGLRLPQTVYTVAGMFGQANAFLAMLMIGLLLEPRIPQESRSDVLRVVLLRYGFGLAASAVCWMLPLPAGIRQVLALSLLAPVPSVSLAYCERCGCDSGAVGAIHSLCIPISLAFTLLVCLM